MAGLKIPLGLVFPESVLSSELFEVLATFVAINTVMYAALAVVKVLPKAQAPEWLRSRRARAETRSIHPDAPY
jgi:hypothetical protein